MAGGSWGVYNILDYNSSNLLSLNSTKPCTWNIIMQGSLGGWGTLNYLKERGYKPGNWLHRWRDSWRGHLGCEAAQRSIRTQGYLFPWAGRTTGYLEAMGWVYSVSTRTMVDLPSRSQGHGREATGGMPPSQRERERMPRRLPSSHPPSPTGSPTGQARSQFVGVSSLLYKVDHWKDKGWIWKTRRLRTGTVHHCHKHIGKHLSIYSPIYRCRYWSLGRLS